MFTCLLRGQTGGATLWYLPRGIDFKRTWASWSQWLMRNSHMVLKWHTCVKPQRPHSCSRGRYSAEALCRDSAQWMRTNSSFGQDTRQPWIGKIIFTPHRFLKTHVRTRGHMGLSTGAARRPVSTWVDRCTPCTRRHPWEAWSMPVSRTSLPLTPYLSGMSRVCPSTITHRCCSNRHTSPPRPTLTLWTKTDTSCLSPGWRLPSPTHTHGGVSGLVMSTT